MTAIVNRLHAIQPVASAPTARALAAGVGDIPLVSAAGVGRDSRRVETGGLAEAAARAMAAEYVPAPDVPTRSRPADPPTPRENFKQAAMASLSTLGKLGGYFDALAQLEPASQPLYRRLAGLIAAIGDRLYDYTDQSTMSQDQLLKLLKVVAEVRQKISDEKFKPDPGTEEGRREIDGLFTKLDSALLIPHTDTQPPSPSTNFKQAAMEELSVLESLMGFFDPLAQLEPDSQPLFRKIAGLKQAITDTGFDLGNPKSMRQEDLLALLRTAKEIRGKLKAEGFKTPDPRTPEGRQEIAALFEKLPAIVAYAPADPPTPRENFKQAAMVSLSTLDKLGGYFDALAQHEPASQPLYRRLAGLIAAIGDRLYDYTDQSTMSQDQLLKLLKVVAEVRQKISDEKFKPDPGTEEGRREIDGLFTKLDSALLIPHTDTQPPSPSTNFKQAAMEELSVLESLMGFFDPLAQLEPDSQPLFRKIAGLKQAITDTGFDLRNPKSMRQEDLLALLRAAKEIREKLKAEGFKAPDPRTPEGRQEIMALFEQLPAIVAYAPADLPTPRENFKQAAMVSLSLLNRLGGYFDGVAQTEEPSRSLFQRLAGLIASINERTLNYQDKTGFTQDQLLQVLRAAREIRSKLSDETFKPDPGTEEGRREIDGLFTRLDSAMALPSIPIPPPSLQDNFRQGAMEELTVLDRLGDLFSDITRLEPDSQPLFLKLRGLFNTLGDRLYGHNRLGALHPANLTALLKTTQAIRDVLGDKSRRPDPGTAEGRAKIDGFVTTLANQIGLPFA